jgi:hypothetical protein
MGQGTSRNTHTTPEGRGGHRSNIDYSQCWSANVKVPKALLSEARETLEKNADGGHMITTGSIAVSLNTCLLRLRDLLILTTTHLSHLLCLRVMLT